MIPRIFPRAARALSRSWSTPRPVLDHRARRIQGWMYSSTRPVASQSDAAAQRKYQIVPDVDDFAESESTRPDVDHDQKIEVTKSPYPEWHDGQGVSDKDASLAQRREIDPYAVDRL
ncbi:hypothetical protein N7492_001831 [Penicillium capsulatum]|uniref:Uncharacterized protein n=1 Tax=Penicillium capsulatum TaxID=69766 RepID=A0A9W9IWJ1_9EURO|nr:hypothetical protein N7492_001831 [Penicillium capsulatum]KAJ6129120.1 hypothetical protein N7512_001900 [Penicillium capsulatum]